MKGILLYIYCWDANVSLSFHQLRRRVKGNFIRAEQGRRVPFSEGSSKAVDYSFNANDKRTKLLGHTNHFQQIIDIHHDAASLDSFPGTRVQRQLILEQRLDLSDASIVTVGGATFVL